MPTAHSQLPFPAPPFRMDYGAFRTDRPMGILGLHWVMLIMHLPAYESARFRVVGAAEINDERIREARARFGISRVTKDWRELVEADDVELIDCCFGHRPDREQRKLDVVEAAAANGKHLLLAKPVASTLAIAERMAEAAERAGTRLAVNQNCRYNPANYSVKQLLTADRLGPPAIIELQTYWKGHFSHLRGTGGAAVGHTIHHADLIRWWAGGQCVSAYSRARGLSNLTIYEFDNGVLAYHMENHSGVQAHVVHARVQTERGLIRSAHNWNWHLPSSRDHDWVVVHLDREDPGIRLDLPEHIYEPNWSLHNPFIPHAGPYYDLAAPIAGMMGSMGALMQGLDEGRSPDNDIRGAIASYRMCLAAQLSAETGKPVDPRDVPPNTVGVREPHARRAAAPDHDATPLPAPAPSQP